MKISQATLLALLLAVALFNEDCDARKKGRRRRRNRRRKHHVKPILPQDCGPIPHLDNASALHTEDGVHYACQPGFRLEGTNTITCIDGRWTVAPRCVRQVCPTPPLVAYANPPQLTASGTAVTYTCQSGYHIVNGHKAVSKTLHCNVHSQQWPALPQCEHIPTETCGAPPAVPNASSEVSGKTATYTCNAGYIQKSGTPSQIKCRGYQWWYSILPACVKDPSTTVPPLKCKAPPCGGPKIMRGDVADYYDIGSKVTYTCIEGCRIEDQANNINTAEVECRSDGTWSAVPACEPVVCGQPEHAANGNTQIIAAIAVTYNSQYTYRCIDLFTTTQPTVAVCQADGMWSIPPPICTIRVCPYTTLPVLANGAPWSVPVNVDIPVGTQVAYQCNTNYRLAPSPPADGVLQQITCLSNGTWSEFLYVCVYRYPLNCKDYYRRDNLFAAAAIGATVDIYIDADGPTGNLLPFKVTCFKKSATEVGTRISPNAGSNLNGAVASCDGDTFCGGVMFSPGVGVDERSGVCDTAVVSYPATAAQIAALFTVCCNCRQQVAIACSGIDTDIDANFIALVRNGHNDCVFYSPISAEIGTAAVPSVTPLIDFLSAPCDCHYQNACSGCFCSSATILPAAADTITLPLIASAPHYVTSYARIGGDVQDGMATTPALAAGELDVAIGPIECCDTY